MSNILTNKKKKELGEEVPKRFFASLIQMLRATKNSTVVPLADSNWGLSTQQLVEEIKLAIDDYFDCDTTIKDGIISLIFRGGERFTLTIARQS